jgi:hypothetical protein
LAKTDFATLGLIFTALIMIRALRTLLMISPRWGFKFNILFGYAGFDRLASTGSATTTIAATAGQGLFDIGYSIFVFFQFPNHKTSFI